MLLAAALWSQPAVSPRRWRRVLAVAGAALLLVSISALMPYENPYAAATDIGPARLLEVLGFPSAAPASAGRALLASVEELSAVSPVALLTGRAFLSWLGPLLLLAPVLLLALARDRRPAAWTAGAVFLGLACAALFVLSLMFYRSKVLLAPVAAVVLGGLAARAIAVARAQVPARGAAAGSRRA